MEKVLKIQKENIDRFVSRELKRQLDVIKIVFGCILVLFVILGVVSKIYFLPFLATGLFIVVFLYVSAILKGDLKALSTAFTFTIGDNSISRQVDWSKINSFMKIRANRASHRYGSNLDQTIELNNVDKISIGKNGIKITSTNANVLNGNGIINLPAELAFYEDVLNHLKSNPFLYAKITQQ